MTKKKPFYKKVAQRWKDETPDFWKTIRNWAIGIGGSAMGLIGIDKMIGLQEYGVAPIIFTIASYIIVICCTLGLSALITHKNNLNDDLD